MGSSWAVSLQTLVSGLMLTVACRMLSDQELNLCLISLVQYLGHDISFISGVAYSEVSRVFPKL